MKQDDAQAIALQAISFIFENQSYLDHFFAQSGLTMNDLKTSLNNAEVLAGVMDTLLSNEEMLVDFCQKVNLAPQQFIAARQLLPGGYTIYS